jgi:hypothetical protein
VFANDVLIFGEIHTECFVVGDVRFKPLDIGAKLAQYPVRFCCGSAKLLRSKLPTLGISRSMMNLRSVAITLSPDVFDLLQ